MEEYDQKYLNYLNTHSSDMSLTAGETSSLNKLNRRYARNIDASRKKDTNLVWMFIYLTLIIILLSMYINIYI